MSRRVLPWSVIVGGAAVGMALSLTGAPSAEHAASPSVSSGIPTAGVVAAQVPGGFAEVLQSVEGLDPTACALVRRALHSRWSQGGVKPRVDIPGGIDVAAETRVDQLLDRRPDATDEGLLLDGLGSSDRCAREVAAELLGWMRPGPVDALARLFGRDPTGQGLMALRALGHGEWVEGLPTLRAAVRHSDPDVRAGAAWALGNLEDPATLSELTALLSDADVGVRRTSAWALGRIERSAAVPDLAPLLDDTDASVRLNTAWALGQIEHSSAIPALVSHLATDSDPAVRHAIAWALGRIE